MDARKVEMERLQRVIFPSGRPPTTTSGRDEAAGALAATADESAGCSEKDDDVEARGASQQQVTRLEETFAGLRAVCGVRRTEDVQNRFLGQRATRERLREMRATTEEEKMLLEKTRQQLANEIEMHKFSETKNADRLVSRAAIIYIYTARRNLIYYIVVYTAGQS